jgi:hydroxyacylglutathione hydrolase
MKISGNIHQLRIDFEITVTPEIKIPRFVNILIVFGDKITLIDTGVKESEKVIFDYIVENGRNISDIERVILSHSHPDHIGSAAQIREKTGCRIQAHKDEREWIEDITIQNRERPVPGFFNLVNRSVKIDYLLADGQELILGKELTAKIIHSPGHSKGSLNILFSEDKVLFTADSIPLKNDIPNYDNYTDLLNSLSIIRSDKRYDTLLTSWTAPLINRADIDELITEGEEYVKKIDTAVKEFFVNGKDDFPNSCKETIARLGLPLFHVNPLVNRALLSHLT